MVISTAKFPPLRIAVCARERKALAKEQPFCRLHAGRDLGGPLARTAGARSYVPSKLGTQQISKQFADLAVQDRDICHRLALGELEALACALLAVLLAFLHAGIASQKSILAQRRTQFRIEHGNRACQAHEDR